MKKAVICALVLMLALFGVTTAADTSAATYSVVSAVVNESYDFDVDFAPWVHEDMSPGDSFTLNDDRPNVTLTLKNDLTGETIEYESRYQSGCFVEAETATLLYETATLPATLTVSGIGEYNVPLTTLPVTVTVTSSPKAALRQKYFDVTRGLSTDMTEGVDFTVDAAEPVPGAAITILRAPASFHLDLYDFESGATAVYYGDDARFTFAAASEIGYFSQSDDTFYFDLPGKLVLDDGYEVEFSVRVHAYPSGVAKPDSARSVATGESTAAFLAGALLLTAGAVLIALRRRKPQATP